MGGRNGEGGVGGYICHREGTRGTGKIGKAEALRFRGPGPSNRGELGLGK